MRSSLSSKRVIIAPLLIVFGSPFLSSLCLQASEVLFGDAWLFRAQMQADTTELLAMLGLPSASGARELSVDNWNGGESACACEIATALGIRQEALLPSSGVVVKAAEADGDEVDEVDDADVVGCARMCWPLVTEAMQALTEPTVLVIGCGALRPRGGDVQSLSLLSRLVGAVAQAHVASHVTYQRKGHVYVVLRGWGEDTIEADWSDEDSDEFCISPLH